MIDKCINEQTDLTCDINMIFDYYYYSNDKEISRRWLALASEIKTIDAFLRPTRYGKSLWGLCAIVLFQKSDEELVPYLVELMKWIEDMNWPGATIIEKRLNLFEDTVSYTKAKNYCLELASNCDDKRWLHRLQDLK